MYAIRLIYKYICSYIFYMLVDIVEHIYEMNVYAFI